MNACDAGREGELIFAYTLRDGEGREAASKRLWLNSMTKTGDPGRVHQAPAGEEMTPLEEAARSRSEADWLVGMNATRAATIRLRAAFDGAVSLGRVQTPTLAMLVKRGRREIREFKPEPYWLVEAAFRGDRRPPLRRALPRRQASAGGGCGRRRRGLHRQAGRDHEDRAEGGAGASAAPLRPRRRSSGTGTRSSGSRPGARSRPRRSSMRIARRSPTRGQARATSRATSWTRSARRQSSSDTNTEYAAAAGTSLGLRDLPLGRVVADDKVGDHHAIIPTRAEHKVDSMGEDERKIYDLVVKRFLAVFHPGGGATSVRGSRRRSPSTSSGRAAEFSSRRAGRRSTARRRVRPDAEDDDSGGDQLLPRLEQGEERARRSPSTRSRRRRKPPRRFTEASLLAAMETAGKDIEDETLREAMKDSGIGTPATRAAIIERLISVGVHRARRPCAARDREGRSTSSGCSASIR